MHTGSSKVIAEELFTEELFTEACEMVKFLVMG
jgi:hypothetical protein